MELAIFAGSGPLISRQYRVSFRNIADRFFQARMAQTATEPFVSLGHRWPYSLPPHGAIMVAVAQRVMADNSTQCRRNQLWSN